MHITARARPMPYINYCSSRTLQSETHVVCLCVRPQCAATPRQAQFHLPHPPVCYVKRKPVVFACATAVRNHIATGRRSVLDRTSEFIALRKDRAVFPVKLTVHLVSGIGEDSIFMGIIEVRVIIKDLSALHGIAYTVVVRATGFTCSRLTAHMTWYTAAKVPAPVSLRSTPHRRLLPPPTPPPCGC